MASDTPGSVGTLNTRSKALVALNRPDSPRHCVVHAKYSRDLTVKTDEVLAINIFGAVFSTYCIYSEDRTGQT